MRAFNPIVACALAAALALSACAQSSSDDASGSAPPAAPQPPHAAAPARDVEAVVDPSGSVERTVFTASLAAVADAVRTVPRALPPHAASAAQPAVHVGVRAIEGQSYSPDALLASGDVDAIPAVDGLPNATDADITQAALTIGAQRRDALAAYARARAQASQLADRIARLHPPVAGCSDVWGAISAAAQSFAAPDRRLIVVSDMAIHCRSNTAGRLDGTRVLIVHVCATADVCAGQEHYWRRTLRDRGATSVEFVRFERMRERIRAYVQELKP